jgi:hypothetical protein
VLEVLWSLGKGRYETIVATRNLIITLKDQVQLEEAARMAKVVLEKRQYVLPRTILPPS